MHLNVYMGVGAMWGSHMRCRKTSSVGALRDIRQAVVLKPEVY